MHSQHLDTRGPFFLYKRHASYSNKKDLGFLSTAKTIKIKYIAPPKCADLLNYNFFLMLRWGGMKWPMYFYANIRMQLIVLLLYYQLGCNMSSYTIRLLELNKFHRNLKWTTTFFRTKINRYPLKFTETLSCRRSTQDGPQYFLSQHNKEVRVRHLTSVITIASVHNETPSHHSYRLRMFVVYTFCHHPLPALISLPVIWNHLYREKWNPETFSAAGDGVSGRCLEASWWSLMVERGRSVEQGLLLTDGTQHNADWTMCSARRSACAHGY